MVGRMRQISLRSFRLSIADLHEPVEVSRRDGSGNIQVLGYWTPYAQYAPDAQPVAAANEEGDFAVRPVRAVPKPGASGRRSR